ncbi:MAG: hypothetical protein RLZZ337_443 [Bacteroidota bacterium]|jgi:hypothetical protein
MNLIKDISAEVRLFSLVFLFCTFFVVYGKQEVATEGNAKSELAFGASKKVNSLDSILRYNTVSDSLGTIEQFEACQTYFNKVDVIYNSASKIDKKKLLAPYIKSLEIRSFIFGDEGKNELAIASFFKAIELARTYNLEESFISTHLSAALVYEKVGNLEDCKSQLDIARELLNSTQKKDERGYFYIRLSSFFRYAEQLDSSYFYANESVKHLKKYGPKRLLTDAYMLLGSYFAKIDGDKSIINYQLALDGFNELKKIYSCSLYAPQYFECLF